MEKLAHQLLVKAELRVGLSVCPLVTKVYFAKSAESIEVPFRVLGRLRLRYDVVNGEPTSTREGHFFVGMGGAMQWKGGRHGLFPNYLRFLVDLTWVICVSVRLCVGYTGVLCKNG